MSRFEKYPVNEIGCKHKNAKTTKVETYCPDCGDVLSDAPIDKFDKLRIYSKKKEKEE